MMHLYGSPAIDQEWARFKAGELFSATRLCRDHFDQNLSCGVPLQPDVPTTLQDIDATVLPDRALVEDCASFYMRSIMRATFPILHPCLFERTLKLAYEPAGHRHPHKTNAKACVMALCMFAHLVPFGHRVISTSDCRLYIAVIGHLLPSMAEVPTIDGFQTCILLVSPRPAFCFLPGGPSVVLPLSSFIEYQNRSSIKLITQLFSCCHNSTLAN